MYQSSPCYSQASLQHYLHRASAFDSCQLKLTELYGDQRLDIMMLMYFMKFRCCPVFYVCLLLCFVVFVELYGDQRREIMMLKYFMKFRHCPVFFVCLLLWLQSVSCCMYWRWRRWLQECFEVISPVLQHVVDLMNDERQLVATTHSLIQADQPSKSDELLASRRTDNYQVL